MTIHPKRCDPVGLHVGARIRQARVCRGISQTAHGKTLQLPITFQQIQKNYENGARQVTASRLWQIAMPLSVNNSFFFDASIERGRPIKGGAANRIGPSSDLHFTVD